MKLFLLSLLWIFVGLYGQNSTDVPYLSHNGNLLLNNSYLERQEVKKFNEDNRVKCHTNMTEGCGVGTWFLPSGSEVKTNDTHVCQAQCNPTPCCVELYRCIGASHIFSGIYSCRITTVTNSSVNETLHIGIYQPSEGE